MKRLVFYIFHCFSMIFNRKHNYKEEVIKTFPDLEKTIKQGDLIFPELFKEVAVKYFILGDYFPNPVLARTTAEQLVDLQRKGFISLKK